MSGGQRRFLAGVVAAAMCLTLPSCGDRGGSGSATSPIHGKRFNEFVFVVDFAKKATVPDQGYIWIGTGAPDTREVWWTFSCDVASADIVSKTPGIIDIKDCKPQPGDTPPLVCKWKLKKNDPNLKGIYGFTIVGYDATHTKIGQVDPDIEVDR